MCTCVLPRFIVSTVFSTHMFRNFTDGADSMRFISAISVDRSAEIRVECPFSGVTKYGRIWRKGAGK